MEHTTMAPDASIAAFAAAVRASLDDLPTDEVDELVEGLESDLLDQASDSGDDFALGDPDVYAAELRSAAGIPPRSEVVLDRRKPSELAAEWVSTRWRSAMDRMRSNSAAAWVIDLLIALRPVWWVARGWAMYAIIAPSLGIGFLTAYAQGGDANPINVVLLAGFVVLSVQWGRGRWAPRRWVRIVRTIVSLVTALALPVLVGMTLDAVRVQTVNESGAYDYTVPGLAVDGERVRNIFAYDSEGNALTDVQLFDQNGHPLTTVGGMGDPTAEWDYYFEGGGGPVPLPWTTPGRPPVWNVFPLREAVPAYEEDGITDVSDAEVPDFPFVQVPAVGGSASSAPSPSPSPSASPSAAPETSTAPAPTAP